MTAKVAVQKNIMSFEVINTDDTPLLIKKNAVLGFGDARSLGFYHVSNNKLKGPIWQTVFLHSHSLVPGANEHAKLPGSQAIRSC